MSHLAEAPSSKTERSKIQVDQWGHFNLSTNEFVMETPFTPRPWKNILWNQQYNTQPTQASGGVSYKRDHDGSIILLNWTGEKYFYLKNTQTGEVFSPSVAPISNKSFEHFEYKIGLSYSLTKIRQCGLEVTVTQSTDHTRPREYFELELKNLRASEQTWRVVFFSDIDLAVGKGKFGSTDRFEATHTADKRRLITRNLLDTKGDHVAYLECSAPFQGWAFDKECFTGTIGSIARPDAVLEDWPSTQNSIESPILSGYLDYTIPSNEACKTSFTLGLSDTSNQDMQTMPLTTAKDIKISRKKQQARFESTYDSLEVSTPDDEFDLFVNTWIKHQLHYCAFWNRGWAKGFRDSNQDAWAFTLLKPEYSKKMILDCLEYQYSDGRTVRKWAPIDRDAYNDGGTWLIFATHAYLAETGDLAALDIEAAFFESEETGTLYEHLRRCVDYLWKTRGDRGLCLMPYGDWNDRLTGPGKDGKGQSVWTTMAMAESLRKMELIAKQCEYHDDEKEFAEKTRNITAILRKEAWNGEWYSRAFTDAGDPVGAPKCTEGSIYLLPQAWSIIAGIATEDQYPKLIEAVENKLQIVHGFRLLTPPYRAFNPSIGHLSAAQPGRLENGGNYCHGSMFMTYALSLAGQRGKAMNALKSTFPTNPKNPPSVSRQEPYSLTNSYASPEAGETSGRSYFSWRTGAAGWALRCSVEGVMGVVATLEGLTVQGTLPVDNWEEASLVRRFRGKKIRIEWNKTGFVSRSLNGTPIDDIPIDDTLLKESENLLQITF
ncbi:hypothetical protein SH580_20710 [Coraliomargarita algicola]|uniref:Glycosyltransferase 36 n=1 Tax=Coraliomargarita algicola TaxID=3092156 RepID=A0ABZ0RLP3_9BACT|nr:hypothetical protein [Coraliomargarita sp. J2-16]WPJ95842.1 hypothetical protein SH580_20710 [Coraliomargarita sp. J2-16]